MLRRKVVVLCLILVFALGTGSAFAATVDNTTPSEKLLNMAARANETINWAVETAQGAADKVVAAYHDGKLSYAAADTSLALICRTVRIVTDAVIIPVIRQADQEGISWDCDYYAVSIGWRTVLIDPIEVPGSCD